MNDHLSTIAARHGGYGQAIRQKLSGSFATSQGRAQAFAPQVRLARLRRVLVAVGAYCDIGAMSGLGELGVTLLIFTLVTVLIHGVIVYGLAWTFRVNPVIASIASQANVGGGTSALALARSKGEHYIDTLGRVV